MITVKQAINSAITYMREFQQYMPNSDQRLEEVEFDYDRQEWQLTISFIENALSSDPRIYKQFFIDGENAEVKAMKNYVPF